MNKLASRTAAACIALGIGCTSAALERGDNAAARPQAAPVRVEFRLAQETPRPGWRQHHDPYDSTTIYVADRVDLSNADFEIVDAWVAPEGAILRIMFTDQGRERFVRLTGENLNRRLAVLIDGRLVGAPLIVAGFSGELPHTTVTAQVPPAEAERIVRAVTGR